MPSPLHLQGTRLVGFWDLVGNKMAHDSILTVLRLDWKRCWELFKSSDKGYSEQNWGLLGKMGVRDLESLIGVKIHSKRPFLSVIPPPHPKTHTVYSYHLTPSRGSCGSKLQDGAQYFSNSDSNFTFQK